MGKFINHGWQSSASNAPQPTGIVTGANLGRPSTEPLPPPKKGKSRSSSKPVQSPTQREISEAIEEIEPYGVQPRPSTPPKTSD